MRVKDKWPPLVALLILNILIPDFIVLVECIVNGAAYDFNYLELNTGVNDICSKLGGCFGHLYPFYFVVLLQGHFIFSQLYKNPHAIIEHYD